MILFVPWILNGNCRLKTEESWGDSRRLKINLSLICRYPQDALAGCTAPEFPNAPKTPSHHQRGQLPVQAREISAVLQGAAAVLIFTGSHLLSRSVTATLPKNKAERHQLVNFPPGRLTSLGVPLQQVSG